MNNEKQEAVINLNNMIYKLLYKHYNKKEHILEMDNQTGQRLLAMLMTADRLAGGSCSCI
ncbi:MAG TPA: hypothetical protein VKS21_07995 [Spirochaetota bacterium]|nr:hypothetical protein [Spirochaetota bacterium]